MNKRIFDHDAMTGTTSYWHVKDNGEYAIENVQDVSAIVDQNKRQLNDTSGKFGDVAKVASIPLSVYYELKKQGIVDDPVAFKRWLNDPDNRAFRTRGGSL